MQVRYGRCEDGVKTIPYPIICPPRLTTGKAGGSECLPARNGLPSVRDAHPQDGHGPDQKTEVRERNRCDYSARSTVAGWVCAAVRAGKAATAFASTMMAGMASSTSGEMTGRGSMAT